MATQLLNDDGTASMATLMMSSHHAFRRDIACFERALEQLDATRIEALRGEWQYFRQSLHGHHTLEDTAIFPGLRESQPQLATSFDALDRQHHDLDALLARGDASFAALDARGRDGALDVVRAIARALAEHLDTEEPVVTPFVRGNREFPVPPSDEAYAMYADGFAWSCAGIAEPVVAQIHAMLPAGLRERLPAARVAFDARCDRVWGYRHAPASTTSVPAT